VTARKLYALNSRTYHFVPLFSAAELLWPVLCPMFWKESKMYTSQKFHNKRYIKYRWELKKKE